MNSKKKPDTKIARLDSDQILKSLPEGFTGVSIPNGTMTVYVEADSAKLDKTAAEKAAKKLAKSLGLSVVHSISTDEYHRFTLEDLQFNKDMRAEAKACLKAVEVFFSKYGIAYRYDDDACETVRKIVRKFNNDE